MSIPTGYILPDLTVSKETMRWCPTPPTPERVTLSIDLTEVDWSDPPAVREHVERLVDQALAERSS